jgi:hypothetical protein
MEVDVLHEAGEVVQGRVDVALGTAILPRDSPDGRALEPLALRLRRQLANAEHQHRLLGDRRRVSGLRPEVAMAMPGDDGRGHAGEEAADRRLRRVEVGMGVDPDDAALRVVETGEDAEASVA